MWHWVSSAKKAEFYQIDMIEKNDEAAVELISPSFGLRPLYLLAAPMSLSSHA